MAELAELVVTCEHGGNRVPRRYAALFQEREDLLQSHRGYDPGALGLARAFSKAFDAPLLAVTVTRLLVEANRSPGSRSLFSELTRSLPRSEQERILERYYRPHRRGAEHLVEDLVRAGKTALHLSVHTFVPVLHGRVRSAEVGLLYDPGRSGERAFCSAWRKALGERAPGLRVRRNYPYRGTADALVTHLRRRYPPARYLGIELEVNQGLPEASAKAWQEVQRSLVETFRATHSRCSSTP